MTGAALLRGSPSWLTPGDPHLMCKLVCSARGVSHARMHNKPGQRATSIGLAQLNRPVHNHDRVIRPSFGLRYRGPEAAIEQTHAHRLNGCGELACRVVDHLG